MEQKKVTELITIHSHTKVAVITGAGISAESGIKTFRDSDGLWENHKIEDVATPEAFSRNPELVWDFYKQRYISASSAEPNPAHIALAEMEHKLNSNFHLITQNIDGLHIKAGNRNVIEMHGNLQKSFCPHCHKNYLISDIDLEAKLPYCNKCGNILRPDIVWFGEIPYHLEKIEKLILKCNIFIVIGTSGLVYPAAGFVMAAKYHGAITIGINLEKPVNMKYFDYFFQGKSGDLLPDLVKQWLH